MMDIVWVTALHIYSLALCRGLPTHGLKEEFANHILQRPIKFIKVELKAFFTWV